MPAHSKPSCPHCGGDLSHYFDGGEVPDADLGPKKDQDTPDYQLPVYRGESAKRRDADRASSEDAAKQKQNEAFAAALRRRRRA